VNSHRFINNFNIFSILVAIVSLTPYNNLWAHFVVEIILVLSSSCSYGVLVANGYINNGLGINLDSKFVILLFNLVFSSTCSKLDSLRMRHMESCNLRDPFSPNYLTSKSNQTHKLVIQEIPSIF